MGRDRQPLVISTSAFPNNSTMGLTGFNELWKDFDIRISTAARLSSSYPFVSPSARPDGYAISYPDHHLVDGGYYDNFGLYSLIAWIYEALHDDEHRNVPRNLVVLQIRSFPDPADDPAAIGRTRQGWLAQTYAPLQTVMKTRVAAQLRQARSLMTYFSENERARKFSVLPVDLVYGAVQEECQKPPLSWKLTESQKRCVRDAPIKDAAVKMGCIRQYLAYDASDPGPSEARCWTIQ